METLIQITFGNHSNVGMKRKINQDAFGTAENDWGRIFVLADGMGGYNGGEIASALATELICEGFKKSDEKTAPVLLLENLFKIAHEAIINKAEENPDIAEMGTTIVAVIIKGNLAYIGHVGDSRAYIFREKRLYWTTKDHSFVQDLLEKGLITEKEALNHPNKNRILQALGSEKISPSYETKNLINGDKLVLCSDGLHGEVKTEEILSIIDDHDPMSASHKLVALANEKGGPDNITVITIYVESVNVKIEKMEKVKTSLSKTSAKKRAKINRLGPRSILIGLLIIVGLLLIKSFSNDCENNKANKDPKCSSTIEKTDDEEAADEKEDPSKSEVETSKQK